jgi:hypothetical protein
MENLEQKKIMPRINLNIIKIENIILDYTIFIYKVSTVRTEYKREDRSNKSN